MVRIKKGENSIDAIIRVSSKYNLNYRILCDTIFKEVNKEKKKRNYCKMCNIVLPKTYHAINYNGQINHLIINHTIKEITEFIKHEKIC
jgi:hypothetical protein